MRKHVSGKATSQDTTTRVTYKSVVASLPDAVLILDARNRVISVNSALVRYLGRAITELEGRHVTEIFGQAAQILEKYNQTMHGREELFVDGRYVEMLVSPLYANNDLVGRIVTFRDMNVRKQTEIALFAYERRYRALFEYSNDAIFILDLDLTILIANQRAADMVGVALDDLLQTSLREHVNPGEHSDMENRVQWLLTGDTIPFYERRFVRNDDEVVWAEISLSLVRDDNGEPLHIQMIVRDISKRKEAEAELKARIEQMAQLRRIDAQVSSSLKVDDVAQVALDAFMELSHADAGFLALPNGEHMAIYKVAGDYPTTFVGDVLTYDVGIAGRILESHEPEIVLNLHRDPDYVPILSNTQAVMAYPLIAQDRLVGMVYLETSQPEQFNENTHSMVQLVVNRVAIALDNANLHHFVQDQLTELQHLYENVSRLEQLKSDMIRMASHDLKNPIGIVRGYLGMLDLDRNGMSEMQAIAMEEIGKSVRRMEKIVSDILTLENIQMQAQTGSEQHINLNLLVRRAMAEFRGQATQKQQLLQAEDLPDPDVLVYGHEAQLYEALTNLIGNAIKYTPDEGFINVRLTRQGNQTILFEVEDNGYGIPRDRQDRLFEPFYRAKVEGTEEIEGTGLGLHLVRNIIERHKGQMVFESVFGEGSTFGFILPEAAPQSET